MAYVALFSFSLPQESRHHFDGRVSGEAAECLDETPEVADIP